MGYCPWQECPHFCVCNGRINMENIGIQTHESDYEKNRNSELLNMLKTSLIPEDQILSNLGLFLNSKNLSRILFINYIYTKIINIQGVIMEFGSRWGQNLALFSALRGIYEPFNRHRKIIGFDTFSGFPNIHNKDGNADMMKKNNLSVSHNYKCYLQKILQIHEDSNPLSHITKFEICQGDAIRQLPEYLQKNPETIISLAYFDFDLYEPTKKCLEYTLPRLTKGSIVCFDELNDHDSPGETLALAEIVGLNKIRLERPSFASRVSYFIVE